VPSRPRESLQRNYMADKNIALWGLHSLTCHMTLVAYSCHANIEERIPITIDEVDLAMLDDPIDEALGEMDSLHTFSLELTDEKDAVVLLLDISADFTPEIILDQILKALLAMEPINIANSRMMRLGRGDEVLTAMMDDEEGEDEEDIEEKVVENPLEPIL
jgi:hypothetical protein